MKKEWKEQFNKIREPLYNMPEFTILVGVALKEISKLEQMIEKSEIETTRNSRMK